MGAIINVVSFRLEKNPHIKTIFERGLWGFSERYRKGWSRLERGVKVLLYGDGAIRVAGYIKDRSESHEPVNDLVNNPTGYPLHVTLDLLNRDISGVKPIERIELVNRYGIGLAKMGFKGRGLTVFGDVEGATYPWEKFNEIWSEFLKRNNLTEEGLPTMVKPEEVRLSHDDMVNIICKLGELFNFHVRREEWTPDKIYRCDVTWRDYETHISPVKVFEVEFSGNVDHALSSLAHAYDAWRSEQLFLIVEDEKDTERAKRLVEPRIRGAFARISQRLKIVGWADIYMIYENLKRKEELVKVLTKR